MAQQIEPFKFFPLTVCVEERLVERLEKRVMCAVRSTWYVFLCVPVGGTLSLTFNLMEYRKIKSIVDEIQFSLIALTKAIPHEIAVILLQQPTCVSRRREH